MTVQEMIKSFDKLSAEEINLLLEILMKKNQENQEYGRGDNFWQGIEKFRKIIEEEGVIYTELSIDFKIT